jgi:transposase
LPAVLEHETPLPLGLADQRGRPDRHADAFATLQSLNLKVGRAWAIKEALRTLWTYRQPAAVRRFFTRWYGWAVRSRFEPVKDVAATLTRHLAGVLRLSRIRSPMGSPKV